MLTKQTIIQKIEQNKEKIRSFGVVSLALFGSYARDEQVTASDIDFLVEFDKNRGLAKDYFGLMHFLEDLFRTDIDLVKPHLVRKELKEDILKGVRYEAKV